MKTAIKLLILLFALNAGAQTNAKIYVKGNYFYIEKDTRIFEGLSKEVLVKRLTAASTEFYFSNVNNWTNEGIDFANIRDENDAPYASSAAFITWFETNTGKSNGGGSGVGLNWESDTNGGSYSINDVVNYNGVLYKNLTGTNLDTLPNADATNWEKITDLTALLNASENTGIEVEKIVGDNIVRVKTAGVERLKLNEVGLLEIGTLNDVSATASTVGTNLFVDIIDVANHTQFAFDKFLFSTFGMGDPSEANRTADPKIAPEALRGVVEATGATIVKDNVKSQYWAYMHDTPYIKAVTVYFELAGGKLRGAFGSARFRNDLDGLDPSQRVGSFFENAANWQTGGYTSEAITVSYTTNTSANASVDAPTGNTYFEGNLGVGTATPNASAKLQVDSTTQGFLPPRMTEAQRDAIATPSEGLIIYQTDATKGFYYYNGTAWAAL